jgi:hypothetical protein
VSVEDFVMTAQINMETLMTEIADLRRELAHVDEQCRVAHAMAINYRDKYQASEKARASLERKLARRRAKERTDEAVSLP